MTAAISPTSRSGPITPHPKSAIPSLGQPSNPLPAPSSAKKRKRGQDRRLTRWKYCDLCSVLVFTRERLCLGTFDPHRRTHKHAHDLKVVCSCGVVTLRKAFANHCNQSGSHCDAHDPSLPPKSLYQLQGRNKTDYPHNLPLHTVVGSPVSAIPVIVAKQNVPELSDQAHLQQLVHAQQSKIDELQERIKTLERDRNFPYDLQSKNRRSTNVLSTRTASGRHPEEYLRRNTQTSLLLATIHQKNGVSRGLAHWGIAPNNREPFLDALRIAMTDDPNMKNRVTELVAKSADATCGHDLSLQAVAQFATVLHLSKASYKHLRKLFPCGCLPKLTEVTEFLRTLPVPHVELCAGESGARIQDPALMLFHNFLNSLQSKNRQQWHYLTGTFPKEGGRFANMSWRQSVGGQPVTTLFYRIHLDGTGTGLRESTEVLQVADLNNRHNVNSVFCQDLVAMYPCSGVNDGSFKRENFERLALPSCLRLAQLIHPHRYIREEPTGQKPWPAEALEQVLLLPPPLPTAKPAANSTHMQHLQEGAYLSDSVVDDYLTVTVGETCTRPTCWLPLYVLPLFDLVRARNLSFSTAEQMDHWLNSPPHDTNVSADLCRKWKALASYAQQCKSLDSTKSLLFFPHLQHKHFRLFVVDRSSLHLEFYDSLFDYHFQDVPRTVEAIQWFWRLFFGKSLTFQRIISKPQQQNGFDCGVFICLYAYLRAVCGWQPERIAKEVSQWIVSRFRQRVRQTLLGTLDSRECAIPTQPCALGDDQVECETPTQTCLIGDQVECDDSEEETYEKWKEEEERKLAQDKARAAALRKERMEARRAKHEAINAEFESLLEEPEAQTSAVASDDDVLVDVLSTPAAEPKTNNAATKKEDDVLVDVLSTPAAEPKNANAGKVHKKKKKHRKHKQKKSSENQVKPEETTTGPPVSFAVVVPPGQWPAHDFKVGSMLFQVVYIIGMDDPELRQHLGRAGLKSAHGCPVCAVHRNTRDCFHRSCDKNACMKERWPLSISEMVNLGEWAQAACNKQREYSFESKNLKFVKGCEAVDAEIHLKKLREELREELSKALGYSVTNVTKGYEALLNRSKGQKFPPLFRDVPIWFQGPCALHMFMAITRSLFWITWDFFRGVQLTPIISSILGKMRLQYLNIFTRRLLAGEEVRGKLTLIGRDCEKLSSRMSVYLRQCRERTTQQHREIWDPLVTLWDLWNEASTYLRHMELTDEQVDACGPIQEKFFQHLSNFPASCRTWYMHFLRDHVPQYLRIWRDEGLKWDNGRYWGYAVMTTQAMEHKFQDLKKTLKHTLHNKGKFIHTLHTLLLCKVAFFDDYCHETRKGLTCGDCGQKGHMCTNSKCTGYDIEKFPHHKRQKVKFRVGVDLTTDLPNTIDFPADFAPNNVWPMVDSWAHLSRSIELEPDHDDGDTVPGSDLHLVLRSVDRVVTPETTVTESDDTHESDDGDPDDFARPFKRQKPSISKTRADVGLEDEGFDL